MLVQDEAAKTDHILFSPDREPSAHCTPPGIHPTPPLFCAPKRALARLQQSRTSI
ncbi:hypothetical protein BD310DRAFT_928675 [Dichomitus squalens]|uniref:Uncharacterized protein n=1 Tax=Dichomitus squalens TaxID=114155 RepID=A0A4V2K7X1_9APHY|nr:hypothetical protein BD310DRAFT_928675 [Dichomitus squalens]